MDRRGGGELFFDAALTSGATFASETTATPNAPKKRAIDLISSLVGLLAGYFYKLSHQNLKIVGDFLEIRGVFASLPPVSSRLVCFRYGLFWLSCLVSLHEFLWRPVAHRKFALYLPADS